ncbi:hypothetical protein N8Z38_03070 [Amylibacter sp.]|nr:hypothetical protein [Amylibacter sp.]
MSKESGLLRLKEKLNLLKKKSDFTYIAIIVLSIALYVGFDDLISGAASGTARDTISAALAAIFVLITTMYMLNKQTDLEQEKEFKGVIFNKKFQLYDDLITNWLNIAYIDKSINKENYKECLDNHYEILMVAPGNAVKHSTKILAIVTKYYQDGQTKNLEDNDLKEIKRITKEFTDIVREELSISEIEVDNEDQDYKDDNEQIITGKKLTKFKFKGQTYNKRGLVLEIVKYTVNEKSVKTFEELKEIFPDENSTSGIERNKKYNFVVALKSKFDEDDNRIFRKDGEIIRLDKEIIVHNQWGGDDFDFFKDWVEKEFEYKFVEIDPKK